MNALIQDALEKYQVLVYLGAISIGLGVGHLYPYFGALVEGMVWPVLGLLLYSTFTQVPLVNLGDAFRDRRFLVAAVAGNFLLIPLLVAALLMLAPEDPAVRLGLLLVLLLPCTDWFVTFCRLGRGDTLRAVAFAPISLLLQIVLLPLYLWLFLGREMVITLATDEVLFSFTALILLPLGAAWITQRWANRKPNRISVVSALGWLPVPLLALVVFSIAASQVNLVADSLGLLSHLLVVFTAYLLAAALLARFTARWMGLAQEHGRTLSFSFGTRNSFVVLPMALALPSQFELVAVVIVFQSLVELVGMAIFLWWVPNKLFPVSKKWRVSAAKT